MKKMPPKCLNGYIGDDNDKHSTLDAPGGGGGGGKDTLTYGLH